jgi:hypothetical protein
MGEPLRSGNVDTGLVRPELRYEHSYNAPAYNYGTKKNQLTVATDVILFY